MSQLCVHSSSTAPWTHSNACRLSRVAPAVESRSRFHASQAPNASLSNLTTPASHKHQTLRLPVAAAARIRSGISARCSRPVRTDRSMPVIVTHGLHKLEVMASPRRITSSAEATPMIVSEKTSRRVAHKCMAAPLLWAILEFHLAKRTPDNVTARVAADHPICKMSLRG